ncbi:Leaf angle-associated protein [Rhynchospora pubera]|uniref:Protein TILLER ANGLE CONTROL 1 n=1 Tax=Rhynchospora pubera TaxID=906938 RepID=A0AAV8E3K0_9POAL|nr:Leaf angle-associated protein [Rhynchospora pubera]
MAMKVLNWFHQKLHSREDYCPISSKKDEIKEDAIRDSAAERDTEALLLHDILLNGILTIGTLGHEQSFLPEESLLVQEKEKNVQADTGEKIQQEIELPALVVAESKPVSRAGSLKMNWTSMKARECSEALELSEKKEEMEEYRMSIQEKPLLLNEEKRVEKTRTTLAELFAAEVFVQKDPKEVKQKQEEDFVMKKVTEVKFCEDKVQKKKHHTESMSKGTHTLNRLVRKMLRKKIHPEHPNRRSDEGPLMIHAQLLKNSTN